MKKIIILALSIALLQPGTSHCFTGASLRGVGANDYYAVSAPTWQGGHILINNTSSYPITLKAVWLDDGKEVPTGSMTLQPGQSSGEQRYNDDVHYIRCYYGNQRVSCRDTTNLPVQYETDSCGCGSCGGDDTLGMAGGCS